MISVFRSLRLHQFPYTDRLQASTEDRASAVGKDGKLDVFVRKGGCREPLHLRDMYSHSPQGSVFEVSGIRGPCLSFLHPSYHTPFPVAMDQCISGGK